MFFKFVNSVGEITFGTSSEKCDFRLTDAEGLSLVDKSFNTVSYADRDGVVTTDTAVGARTITLAGDMRVDGGFIRRYEKLLRVLNVGGWLEVSAGRKMRKIECRCTSFTPGKKNAAYMTYVIQFMCAYPYFRDLSDTEVSVFSRRDRIDDSFILPGVFTERISRQSILYRGSVKTPPVFIVKVLGEMSEVGLSVINHTYGAKITLNYKAAAGEIITIDTENCKIYNNMGENLIKYISDDTFLNDFYLCPGENDIEVRLCGSSLNLNVTCRYSNMYVEAVF